MYIPTPFQIDDAEKLTAVMREHSFATVVTCYEGVPFASHLPLQFEAQAGAHGTLTGHMARANAQWRHFTPEQEVLAIFQGPHSYISPTWYEATPAVPTWNYVAVHAYGTARLIEDEARLRALLQTTIATYEAGLPQPWNGDLPAAYLAKMLRGIVGFEIGITRLEGKFKLGQNRSPTDLQGVYDALVSADDAGQQALAEVMVQEGLV